MKNLASYYSTTYAANIAAFINTILVIMGFDVDEGLVTESVQLVIATLTAAWIIRERYKKGGIKLSGMRG